MVKAHFSSTNPASPPVKSKAPRHGAKTTFMVPGPAIPGVHTKASTKNTAMRLRKMPWKSDTGADSDAWQKPSCQE